MAYKYARKTMRRRPKKYTKKTTRRTNKVGAKSFGQPRYKIVNLPYHETIPLNNSTGVGLANYYQFRGNSIHDPNLTGVGHQPLGHDQWALFYNHYVVENANITVTFQCPSISTSYYVGICLTDDAVTGAIVGASTFDTVCENKHVRYRLVTSQDSGKNVTLSFHHNPLKFLGRNAYSTDVKTSFGSNPTEQSVYTIFVMPVSVGEDPPDIIASVQMNFRTKLIEPKELIGS